MAGQGSPAGDAGAAGQGPLAVIAAGGTGGHMFPAQALAETLLARGWRVHLSTDARGARYAGAFPAAVTRREVSAASPARGGPLARALVPFRLLAGAAAAYRAFRRERPAVVVGFGGYPTIPALAAARALRIPTMIHESNGVPGEVNRRFAPHVAAVACGTWPTPLPPGASPVHTGNPVRAAVLARAAAPYIPPGDYPMTVLAIGGSQGARVLSDTVPAALAALPDPLRAHLRVSHQARPEDADRVAAAYASAGIPAEVQPFFADIPTRLADAQLVISRAGASSLADIAVIGRPAILIPYAAAAGDHQTANARAMVEAGAASLLPEAGLTPDILAAEVARLLAGAQPGLAMSLAALRAARPDAADRLADLAERLATGHPAQETPE